MQPIRLPSLTREIELMEEEERSPSPRLDSEQPHPPHQHQQPTYPQQYQFQLRSAGVAGAAGGSEAAAGASAGASGRRSERWAKQNDWDAHRDIITSLYRDRGLTLKRVKETMEREYQFYSTERMYKFRLKQWGVAKYIKQRDMGGMSIGTAAHPAATEDCPVDRYEGDYGQGDGAGTHTHGRYYPFVHSHFLPDGSISDVPLQLTNARPRAHKTDGLRPPRPYPSPLTHRPHNQHPVLAPTLPSWPCPASISRSLVVPGDARVLEICVSHLQRFVASICGRGSPGTIALDRSPEISAERIRWTFALGKAVHEIHLGRIAKGFRQLDAAFAEHHFSLGQVDLAFFLKLTTALALLSDKGLTGLDAVFLRYISNAVHLVMSPLHPFAVVTRQLQALDASASVDMAWYLLTLYTNMMWQAWADMEQPLDLLSQLSWDMSRCVDRDYTAVLSKHPSEWSWDLATTALLVAQVQISQRMYGAARRTIDNLLAQQARVGKATAPAGRSSPETDGNSDAHIVALALRKRWDISRAAGGGPEAICRDATALICHCRTALGPTHYATTRAIDEHENYLRARRALVGGGGDGTAGEETGANTAAAVAEARFVDYRPPEG